jgi:hypothetical protein
VSLVPGRLGRRTLHLSGLAGMVAFGTALTVIQSLDTEREEIGILLIVATLLFTVCFGLGPGAIPWMTTAELFSQGGRFTKPKKCFNACVIKQGQLE